MQEEVSFLQSAFEKRSSLLLDMGPEHQRLWQGVGAADERPGDNTSVVQKLMDAEYQQLSYLLGAGPQRRGVVLYMAHQAAEQEAQRRMPPMPSHC